MKKNFKIFFDMDDTITDFNSASEPKDRYFAMYQEGFFKDLNPLPFLNEVNKLAAVCPENVYILTACISNNHCKPEKIEWLKKHLPAACKENIIFTQVGESKAEAASKFIGKKLTPFCVLVDDYSKNIEEWRKMGGTEIKFQNSFNTSDPTKYRYIIKDLSELFTVLEKIREDFDYISDTLDGN